MHTENPPSHPELLAWLARDTAANGYDLKRLIRGIVMSKTYSREQPLRGVGKPARVQDLRGRAAEAADAAPARHVAQDRGHRPGELRRPEAGRVREEDRADRKSSARGFAALIAQPTDNFQIGVGEALLFSNGDRVAKEFLTDGAGTALGRAKR